MLEALNIEFLVAGKLSNFHTLSTSVIGLQKGPSGYLLTYIAECYSNHLGQMHKMLITSILNCICENLFKMPYSIIFDESSDSFWIKDLDELFGLKIGRLQRT